MEHALAAARRHRIRHALPRQQTLAPPVLVLQLEPDSWQRSSRFARHLSNQPITGRCLRRDGPAPENIRNSAHAASIIFRYCCGLLGLRCPCRICGSWRTPTTSTPLQCVWFRTYCKMPPDSGPDFSRPALQTAQANLKLGPPRRRPHFEEILKGGDYVERRNSRRPEVAHAVTRPLHREGTGVPRAGSAGIQAERQRRLA